MDSGRLKENVENNKKINGVGLIYGIVPEFPFKN
jgi:hypothetical protein